MSVTKEWHHSVSDDLRNSLVNKLIQAVSSAYPWNNITRNCHDATLLQTKPDLPMFIVDKLKDVENKYYNEANARSEYYHLIAKMVYYIQKEMSEKKECFNVENTLTGETAAMEPSMSDINQMQEEIADLGKHLDHFLTFK